MISACPTSLLDGFGAPDHSTISRFRQKMGEQIERVFYAVVKYLLNMKEISGENLFIDGTKIDRIQLTDYMKA
ncbi:MAG: transposase [Ruminococcus albus]|nr:transposase [Ruminococcus albus]